MNKKEIPKTVLQGGPFYPVVWRRGPKGNEMSLGFAYFDVSTGLYFVADKREVNVHPNGVFKYNDGEHKLFQITSSDGATCVFVLAGWRNTWNVNTLEVRVSVIDALNGLSSVPADEMTLQFEKNLLPIIPEGQTIDYLFWSLGSWSIFRRVLTKERSAYRSVSCEEIACEHWNENRNGQFDKSYYDDPLVIGDSDGHKAMPPLKDYTHGTPTSISEDLNDLVYDVHCYLRDHETSARPCSVGPVADIWFFSLEDMERESKRRHIDIPKFLLAADDFDA